MPLNYSIKHLHFKPCLFHWMYITLCHWCWLMPSSILQWFLFLNWYPTINIKAIIVLPFYLSFLDHHLIDWQPLITFSANTSNIFCQQLLSTNDDSTPVLTHCISMNPSTIKLPCSLYPNLHHSNQLLNQWIFAHWLSLPIVSNHAHMINRCNH